MLRAQKPPSAITYKESPAFQVMLLGCSGGPREDNVTGLLVRSLATNWQDNSLVAVDAGTMLGGIIRCLELSDTKPIDYNGDNDGVQMLNGAFEGLKLPYKAAESNGAFIFRRLIQSVLVTHAHLDHCSALALNSPLIETETAPKTISALPSVIAALKSYIFNGIIWPNLSDEDEGAGLLTYQRLSDGGNPMLGRGIGRGYVESCKGIMTKAVSISHGKSKQEYNPDTDKFERLAQHSPSDRPNPADCVRAEGGDASMQDTDASLEKAYDQTWAAVDSTAFFLLDIHSGSEILFFGDLEPDRISIRPRNARVWREAAKKMAANSLRGIFVECSYPDAIDDQTL
ncbi:3',5'-cyclic-nucleotide phosphodiesterase pde1, partial [Ascosphaera pollenicola]